MIRPLRIGAFLKVTGFSKYLLILYLDFSVFINV